MYVSATEPGFHQTMASTSEVLIIGMVAAYAIALLLFAVDAAYERRETPAASKTGAGATAEADGSTGSVRAEDPKIGDVRQVVGAAALTATAVGTALAFGQIITRGLAIGDWPWVYTFEFVVAVCMCAVTAFLFTAIYYEGRYLGTFVLIPVVLLLGAAVKWLYIEAEAVIPVLQPYWIAAHACAAVLAAGGFLAAGAAGAASLVAHRAEAKRRAGKPVAAIAAKLPGSDLLDHVSYRFITFAFPLWTFAVLAREIWADQAWSRFWSWSPTEVWFLITWLVYAAYLQARATARWRATQATWVGLIGFACFGVGFFAADGLDSGLHPFTSPTEGFW